MTEPDVKSAQSKLRGLIRNIADFPQAGIIFRDITPLLADAEGLACAARLMADPFRDRQIELVVGAESRGFIFAATVAGQLNSGFVPVRKAGKLPAETIWQEYELEYGTDKLEMHADSIKPGQHVLMVDDLLATGGTMQACCQMVQRLGGQIAGISFLIELAYLHGRKLLADHDVHTVISYERE